MSLDIEKLQKLCWYARLYLEAPCIIAGGAVRDSLHGREVKDIDIFVQVKPEDISKTAEFEGVICSPVEPLFVKRCRALADFFGSLEGADKVSLEYATHPENKSGGDIADLVNIVGTSYPVQVIAVLVDPVDDVQNYDFALSQCFVTPGGLFYTERYLGDANGLTVTYTGDAEIGSARFNRSVLRYQRLKAKYAPEFKFENCDALDKVISGLDAMKYDIVNGGTAGELRDLVQALVDKGWRPVGGVCSSTDTTRDGYGNQWVQTWFHQVITLAPRELEPL